MGKNSLDGMRIEIKTLKEYLDIPDKAHAAAMGAAVPHASLGAAVEAVVEAKGQSWDAQLSRFYSGMHAVSADIDARFLSLRTDLNDTIVPLQADVAQIQDNLIKNFEQQLRSKVGASEMDSFGRALRTVVSQEAQSLSSRLTASFNTILDRVTDRIEHVEKDLCSLQEHFDTFSMCSSPGPWAGAYIPHQATSSSMHSSEHSLLAPTGNVYIPDALGVQPERPYSGSRSGSPSIGRGISAD